MSKFKETLNELLLTGYFADKHSAYSFLSKYDKSAPETQAALDKHPLLVIEKLAPHNAEYRDNISSIKKNLQFIAWMFIISIAIGVIAVIANL
ncbi:MAG: hypothetical protein ABF294_00150 [Flavobacteriales bacterium]|jgi:hypothetical protein